VRGLLLVAAMAAVMWVVAIADQIAHGRLDRFGIEPRDPGRLDGIAFAPFLHAGFEHLIGNMVPSLVIGAAIAGRLLQIGLDLLGPLASPLSTGR